MTDDGTPLELSWDWGTKDDQPMIRYSIEPEHLQRSLGNMRLEWFHHFREFFNGHEDGDKDGDRDATGMSIHDAKDHNTSIFYAFDLSPGEVTAKVYFFPKMRAQVTGQSNLDVLKDGIRTAPCSTAANLAAWDMFCDFTTDPASEGLEYEMLAIDLIDPRESRMKIYFRSRETTFDSVVNTMTLGGRIANAKLHQGLQDLRRLWNALFSVDPDVPGSQSLPAVGHRTAGILYNVEFRLGEECPVAKIYLPVRHYSRSDEGVIRGLDAYFQQHQRGKYMANYVQAMRALFSPETMQKSLGVHTYIGCTIRPNGRLRLVSYFKPGVPESMV
ncbi:aromatic prenyltransferase [Xylaria sp. CBS 124048]|nr:aromatic prenyltransferase [Xylaria sp. CBS 124048]